MLSENASNWVDRGEPPERKIVKALRHFLGFASAPGDAELDAQARVLVGMVEADASEVQIAAYLGHLEDQIERPRVDGAHRRLVAIAIWHIAKAALTRDEAMRMRESQADIDRVERQPLSTWLHDRILRPDADAL